MKSINDSMCYVSYDTECEHLLVFMPDGQKIPLQKSMTLSDNEGEMMEVQITLLVKFKP